MSFHLISILVIDILSAKVHFYIFTFLQRFDFLNLLIINSEIYKYYFIIIIYYIIIYNNIIYNNSL